MGPQFKIRLLALPANIRMVTNTIGLIMYRINLSSIKVYITSISSFLQIEVSKNLVKMRVWLQVRLYHRDKPRVCTPAKKMFPHLKLIYFIIFCLWAPLLVLTQSKETVSSCFFYNKSKILSILFIVKYEKNHTF